ncbi:MAG TPA: efflux RND transporter permease subunit, partial [Burkholderiales bacterium]|nr:efflux RND transporter permease subunit [Burkholderiales bacterium]
MIPAIIRFAIRFPGVVIAVSAVLVLYGLYVLSRADLNVFPEFSPTQVVIQTEAPGLSADLVETQVTQRIENSLAGISSIESLRSQSIPGLSVVTLIFTQDTDIQFNRQAVAERLRGLSLPRGVAAPTLTPLTSSASTVLGVGLTSKTRSLMELRTLTDWTIKPHLLSVRGVADVNIFGGDLRQWQIQVSPQKLLAHQVALQDVLAAAREASGVRGAGYVENVNQRIVLDTAGQALNLDDLRHVLLTRRDGRSLTLSDVGKIAEAPAPSISAAAINGEPGVFLLIQGQLGANVHAVTDALEVALSELKPLLEAEKVELHPGLFRPANFIDTAVNNVQRDIAIGSILVVTILVLFLFNVRTAFVCAVAIPMSLLAAVLALDYFGVSLDIMVLGGLAIALGEVVDDAIIDSENIFRRLRENRALPKPRPAHEVVLTASLEVRRSVIYATFIVALVFVPLLTLSGVAGRLFAPLGLAYILAILASLVVAMTLTPALCYLLLAKAKLEARDPPFIAFLKPRYIRVLGRIEKYPGATAVALTVGLAAGIGVLPLFSGEFIPALKEGHYIIHMTAVPGTSEQESLRLGRPVAKAIGAIEGVQSVAQWVGRAENGADTFGTHYSEFEVEIGALPGDEQARILSEIREVLSTQDFLGVLFQVNTFLTERIEETVSGYAAELVINIFGPNLDWLDRDARAVATTVSAIPGAEDVQLQAPAGSAQLSIRLLPERLTTWGFSPVSVLEGVQAAYEGARVGQVYLGNRVVDITVVLSPEARKRITQVADLSLRNPEGKIVKLSDVADIEVAGGRYKILHLGGKRLQTITANAGGRDIEDFAAEVKERIAREVKLSPGNYAVVTGTAEAQAEAREDLIVHSLLAGVGIFLLLYLAFNSLTNLAITFVNLPFALVGGVLAVLFTGGWLSLGSIVGFVTLFGITLRNSIMLVSHYQHLTQIEGLPWNAETAIRGAAERLPSILMTALVTGFALLPLALGSGEPGREIEGPMASVIVGGLFTS